MGYVGVGKWGGGGAHQIPFVVNSFTYRWPTFVFPLFNTSTYLLNIYINKQGIRGQEKCPKMSESLADTLAVPTEGGTY